MVPYIKTIPADSYRAQLPLFSTSSCYTRLFVHTVFDSARSVDRMTEDTEHVITDATHHKRQQPAVLLSKKVCTASGYQAVVSTAVLQPLRMPSSDIDAAVFLDPLDLWRIVPAESILGMQ